MLTILVRKIIFSDNDIIFVQESKVQGYTFSMCHFWTCWPGGLDGITAVVASSPLDTRVCVLMTSIWINKG